MPLIRIAEPSIEPVSLLEAKNHLRIDADMTSDDALIGLYISAARIYAENYTSRSFILQKWRLILDSFPGPSMIGVPFGVPYSLPGHAILLERAPFINLDSIEYTGMDGQQYTMPATDYKAELSGGIGRITPVFGKIWPIPMPQIGAVIVNYTAGYGDAADDVPAGIRQWILVRINSMYENREEVALLNRGKVEPIPFIDGLLDPYRVAMF